MTDVRGYAEDTIDTVTDETPDRPLSQEELLDRPKPRRFQLKRKVDATGISGTGIVAEGIQFRDGRCTYRWLTAPATTQQADSIHHITHIHGHGGKTKVVWLDE